MSLLSDVRSKFNTTVQNLGNQAKAVKELATNANTRKTTSDYVAQFLSSSPVTRAASSIQRDVTSLNRESRAAKSQGLTFAVPGNTMGLLEYPAAKGTLPPAIQSFAENPYKSPEKPWWDVPGRSSQFAGDLVVNIAKGLLFGDVQQNKEVLKIQDKLVQGSNLTADEKKTYEDFQKAHLLDIAGSTGDVRSIGGEDIAKLVQKDSPELKKIPLFRGTDTSTNQDIATRGFHLSRHGRLGDVIYMTDNKQSASQFGDNIIEGLNAGDFKWKVFNNIAEEDAFMKEQNAKTLSEAINKEGKYDGFFQKDFGEGGNNFVITNKAKADELMKKSELLNTFKDEFVNWVNSRRATDIEGQIAKRDISKAGEGFDTRIYDVQEGAPGFEKVREYFDNKFKQLNKAGINVEYKQNYLPQLWENSEEDVNKVFGKTLTRKPSFTFESVVENYREGIKKGLTPRYNTLGDLVGWYESYANKALADKKFFDYLQGRGFNIPDSNAIESWVKANPDHQKEAEAIGNYLGQASQPIQKFAKFVGRAKQAGLTGGIPGTAINAHGINVLAANTLAENNPVAGFTRGSIWVANPNSASKYVNDNLDEAVTFVRNGMTLQTEDSAYLKIKPVEDGNIAKRLVNKLGQKWEQYFEDPLFKKTIPALKVHYAKQVRDDLVRRGVSQEEATKIAAKTANNIFGGMNYDEMFRNKDVQNVLRSIILAPDWAESRINTGKGIVKGLTSTSAEYKAYRTFARNLIAAYVSLNVINKALSGKWAFQNDAGHQFEIDTNSFTPDGQKRYVRPFGTAVDFVRLPLEIAYGIYNGDLKPVTKTVANRLSLPIGGAIHLVSNADYLGRPILGKDQFGNPIPLETQIGGVIQELESIVGVPAPARSFGDFLTGRNTFENTIAQGLELPLRYQGGAFSDKQKAERDILKARGESGQQINEFFKAAPKEKLTRAEKKQLAEVKKYTQKESVINTIQTKDTERLVRELTALPKEQAKTRLLELAKSDPKLAESVLKDFEDVSNNRNAIERQIASLGVSNGARARYIADQLDKMDNAKRKEYLLSLAEKKLISNEVLNQVLYLMQ